MARMGIRTFQDLVGRTDLLRVFESANPKAKLLNFGPILKNALHMRPGTNIVGGSSRQVCLTILKYIDNHRYTGKIVLKCLFYIISNRQSAYENVQIKLSYAFEFPMYLLYFDMDIHLIKRKKYVWLHLPICHVKRVL
jgi:hypothetical protein